jgi:hypothetical protein
MLRKFTLGSALALACTAPAAILNASEFDAKKVPVDSNWFMHWDFDAGSKSEIFKDLTAETSDGEPNQVYRWLEKRYGIQFEDLSGLTLYATSQPQVDNVALLFGDIDQGKMMEFLSEQESYSKVEVDGIAIHTFEVGDDFQSQDGIRRAASQLGTRRTPTTTIPRTTNVRGTTTTQVVGSRTTENESSETRSVSLAFLDDVAILADDKKSAITAISAIQDGKGIEQKISEQLSDRPENTVITAMLVDLSSAREAATQINSNQLANTSKSVWAIANELDSAFLAVGQKDSEHAFVVVDAKATSKEAAQRASGVLEGLQALVAVSGADLDKMDFGVKAEEFSQNGEDLNIKLSIDAEQICEMMEQSLEDLNMAESDYAEQSPEKLSNAKLSNEKLMNDKSSNDQ